MGRIGEFVRGNLPGASAMQLVRAFQKACDAYSGLGADQELYLEYHSPAGEVFRVARLNFDPTQMPGSLTVKADTQGNWLGSSRR